MNLPPHYNDVLRRAELFTFIADLVRAFPDDEEGAPRAAAAPLRLDPPGQAFAAAPGRELQRILPKVSVLDRRVFCDGAALDLTRRPLMLRLFQAFCTAPEQQLCRDELLRCVYCVPARTEHSERYLESMLGNSVKLVSRARILANAYLSPDVEWFVYDQGRKAWSLYRLKMQYLQDKLG